MVAAPDIEGNLLLDLSHLCSQVPLEHAFPTQK